MYSLQISNTCEQTPPTGTATGKSGNCNGFHFHALRRLIVTLLANISLQFCSFTRRRQKSYQSHYCPGLENREYGHGDPLRWSRDTLYPQMLALTMPTGGGCSVGIVRWRTKASKFNLFGHYCPWLDLSEQRNVKFSLRWYISYDVTPCILVDVFFSKP
jgi:hypothetical protein